jgi:galactokinase
MASSSSPHIASSASSSNPHAIEFNRIFGSLPAVICTAPGRVNLIGEHVDYSGYSVFPFALTQSITIAAATVSKGAGNLIVYSTLMSTSGESAIVVKVSEKYQELRRTLKADSWTDYLLCGINSRVLLEASKGGVSEFHFPDDKDMLVYVDSEIPPAAGLSSSSALVVAMSLAMTQLFPLASDIKYDKLDFVAACVESERLIGTLGGGMDQTACVMANKSEIMHIHFKPVMSVNHVTFPAQELAMVVANSFVSAEKSQGSKFEFNKRFVECKLAAIIIGKYLRSKEEFRKLEGIDWDNMWSLSDIEVIICKYNFSKGQSHVSGSSSNEITAKIRNLSDCLSLAGSILRSDGYSLCDLYESLNVDAASVGYDLGSSGNSPLWDLYFSNRVAAGEVLNRCHGDPNAKILDLLHRARHVWEETIRVLEFRLTCDSIVSDRNPDHYAKLGLLMNSSHESLKVQYECSHLQLDKLVETCRLLGALGARLTGAGWGGCVIALVRKEDEVVFLQRLKESEFYGGFERHLVDANVFSTTPSIGARYEMLSAEEDKV